MTKGVEPEDYASMKAEAEMSNTIPGYPYVTVYHDPMVEKVRELEAELAQLKAATVFQLPEGSIEVIRGSDRIYIDFKVNSTVRVGAYSWLDDEGVRITLERVATTAMDNPVVEVE